MRRPVRVLFLRHGETAGRPGILYSQREVPLSEYGLKQTEILVEGLKKLPIMAIYSSDLKRARLGAEWLAEATKAPLIITPWLREIDFGEWTGKHFSELWELPEFRARLKDPENLAPPGGESLRDLQARALKVIEEIKERFSEGLVVVFTHGGLIRTVIAHALGASLRHFFRIQQDFAAVNLIDYFEDTAVVHLVNGPFDLNFFTLLSRKSLV